MNKTVTFDTPAFVSYASGNGRIWWSSFRPFDISDMNQGIGTGVNAVKPIQFTEWKNLYNRFYVKDIMCTIKLHNLEAPGTAGDIRNASMVLISLFSNSSSVPFTNTSGTSGQGLTWAQEQDLMKATRKQRYRIKRVAPHFRANTIPCTTFHIKENQKRLRNLEGETFENSIGKFLPTSPTFIPFHHIGVREPMNTQGDGNEAGVYMEVSYSMNVLLMDPKTLDPQSS